MGAPVQNIEARHREQSRRGSAQIAEERKTHTRRSGTSDAEGNSKNGVGAEIGLVGGGIEICHQQVDLLLTCGIHADQRGGDGIVYVTNSPGDSLAHPPVAAVTQLDGFKGARRGSGRHESATETTRREDFGFDRGVSP